MDSMMLARSRGHGRMWRLGARRLIYLLVILIPYGGDRVEALDISTQFNPSDTGSMCGIGVDHTSGDIWVYQCSSTAIQSYSSAGVFQSSVMQPGETANDVDIDFSMEGMTLNGTSLAPGTLLFNNGETDVVDVYAVNKANGAVIETLATNFGVSHVVGGAYHPDRGTLFFVQDRVPGVDDENRIAEVDTTTGAVLNTFQIGAVFDVNYGDMDVCPSTGHLFVVSSIESSIAEFMPDGSLVGYHQLPVGVTSLSGIAIGRGDEIVWVSGGGIVWGLSDFPCVGLFLDGFETGDTSRWSSTVQ